MHRSVWLRLGAVTTALLLPMGTAMAAPSPGAPGVGDPYYPDYGNGGFDIQHYNLDIEYNNKTNIVNGRTTLAAKATQDLSRFNLDLVLRAKLVRVNGKQAKFTQTEHELIVTPPDKVAKGKAMTVEVTYAGNPSTSTVNGYSPWIKTKDGAAAVGEPEIAAWWFAGNDHPRDKATYDINVTVPKDQEVLSNGVLKSNKATGQWRTWRWSETKPMAPYLAFFVSGQFDITKSTWKGLPFINAVASNGGAEGSYAKTDLARTGEVLDWQTSQFGPYPFDAIGGVAPAADFGFALENQSRPVYTRGFWRNGSNMYVVVHENAHQWFGDSVSVQNWRDIWVNEGFASYVEWMWSAKQGDGTEQALFDSYYLTPPDDDFWTTKIGDPGKGNEFDGAVYDRGAMTLQALRNRIGDKHFFETLRTWVKDRKYGNGSNQQFKALAEKISGQNLGGFFNAWLYSTSRPAPTTANGFPANFPERAKQKAAAPKSRAMLDHNHALMTQQLKNR